MAGKSEILKEPTDHLNRLLCADLTDAERMRGWFELHRHILAGGALPAQWRGEGTAVLRLIREANADAAAMGAIRRAAAQSTRAAIRAVTGEG